MATVAIDEIRSKVLAWEETIRQDTAMYSRLAQAVAGNDDLLTILQDVPPGQLPMNMLLGAVQYLLFADREHPLADWYPSLGGVKSGEGLEAEFATFVCEHREAIGSLLRTRLVQTNEVARCAFLLPAYNLVNALTGRPIALIEVGTSAGLNQNIDRYGYRFESDAETVELAPHSIVQLATRTGTRVPPVARSIPDLAWRTGLDLHPVNVTNPDEARWLRALIWPDRPDRHTLFGAAIQLAQIHPPTLVEGNAFERVPQLVEAAPSEAAVVVQHSFVLNQFAPTDRDRFYVLLDELAADRSIYRIGAESLKTERGTILDLTVHGPNRSTRELASVHHHGAWIDWFDLP